MNPFLALPLISAGMIVGLRALDRLSELRAIAKAQRLERQVPCIVARELVAQVERKRVTVDYLGNALVIASCDEECATIISQSAAFGARERMAS